MSMFSLSVLVNNLVLISFCPQKCLFYIILTWVSSVALYILIAMPDIGFHFNVNGLMICEAYFRSNVALVLTADFFYFPTTMILMYCYGTGMLKWVFRILFHFFYSLFPEKLEKKIKNSVIWLEWLDWICQMGKSVHPHPHFVKGKRQCTITTF